MEARHQAACLLLMFHPSQNGTGRRAHALDRGAHVDAELLPAEGQAEDEARQQALALHLPHKQDAQPETSATVAAAPKHDKLTKARSFGAKSCLLMLPNATKCRQECTLASMPAWMRSSTRGTAMKSDGRSAATSSVIFFGLPCHEK